MPWRNSLTTSAPSVLPPAKSSAVSSQSTLSSLRATKPSRLAAMWSVTRESAVIAAPERLGDPCPNERANNLLAIRGRGLEADGQSVADDGHRPRDRLADVLG